MGTADSTGAAAQLAALLSTLKERSGLSYGALGKRLHLSASTLHRYCNGDAVPADFAPLNRFARLCRATPEELVEVHRRWILADAAREQRGKGAGGGAGGDAPAAGSGTQASTPDADGVPGSPDSPESPEGSKTSDAPPSLRPRRRLVLAATAGVVAVAAAGALLVGRLGSEGPGAGAGQPAGATRGPVASSQASGSGSPSPSGSASDEPSASPSPSGTPSASPGSPADGKPAAPASTGVPFHASVRAHAWEDQCSQRYLVDREPDAVRPPPVEQDAPAWVAAMGAVSADEQVVEVTLQGKGSETVVLQALHVRVVRTGEPLPWTDYGTGVGCGGGVALRAFDVDLDQGAPAARAAEGQRPFPYKIRESDPEMFRVTAHTGGRDVSWYLEVEWSSGERQGVFRVDDRGRPFRTSASAGRPAYDYPPGASEWSEHQPG
ncbi:MULTISPECIES: helix-turn-helix transcriptional regulator [Streptomyces]|uniref:Helix-turn-helix domain-containing protein n=2 Tax=Streptomyces albidoflavus group TaxID=1477431 RepID=A0A7Y6KJP4_9ACTN|nr:MULTISPECIES: helix-turn-helix transcriptional regulator [Streptomyces]NUV32301.1 helix-turn-helix domain-containing protein [Streptomyces odorifer]NUV48142.1 helix-turn-helix domain-containing protein [Streptomyces sp. CAI-78]UYX95428.1 helix-turn-helix domain-containing protein [Streptomyces sp. BI87]